MAWPHFILTGTAGASVLLAPAPAAAEEVTATDEADASDQPAPRYRPSHTMPGPFRSWHFRDGWELQIDRFWARRSDLATAEPGIGIALGTVNHRIPNPWFLIGTRQMPVRILDSKSFSVSLSRHLLRGGVKVGAFDLVGGFGFSTLTVDVVHATWSVGLLSPLATAGIGVRVGRVRLSLSGYVEYLWRWTADDFWVRGFSVAASLDDPP